MSKEIVIPNLKPETVDVIRNLALESESTDLEIAQELMNLAHQARPSGPFIKKKLIEYNSKLGITRAKSIVTRMIANEELVIIPVGFRCHTKINIYEALSISKASFPFDSGFFPPSSVASVINNPVVNLTDSGEIFNSSVCMKYENHNDPVSGSGIKFQRSTYNEIDSIATNRDVKGINKCLDASYGYYTLDPQHNFVLAHYNWHSLADPIRSKGITDPKINIQKINETLNKRIKRMFDLCTSAKHIIFAYGEYQKYNYMMIDNKYFDLKDLSMIEVAVKNSFDVPSYVTVSENINSAEKVLELINKSYV